MNCDHSQKFISSLVTLVSTCNLTVSILYFRPPQYESPISKANYEHQYEPNFETHEHISEKYQQFIPDENYVQHHRPKFQSLDLEPNLRHTR